ncbi:MAG: hypothetical protein H7Y86_03380 [Rhizobacter sp.]|nr:hypothetical protein [Ferruginibacter sp.]
MTKALTRKCVAEIISTYIPVFCGAIKDPVPDDEPACSPAKRQFILAMKSALMMVRYMYCYPTNPWPFVIKPVVTSKRCKEMTSIFQTPGIFMMLVAVAKIFYQV